MRKRHSHFDNSNVNGLSSSFLESILDAKRRLSGEDLRVKLTPGVEDVTDVLHSVITGSPKKKSGTSVVVLGPRGSGKSAAVRRALTRADEELGEGIVTVRLNGLLHSEPAAGYEGIAAALDEKGKGVGNALAVISERVGDMRNKNITLVVVLDDFEKFVAGDQEVLYNLMNVVQCQKLSSVVIGMSSKIDAVDCLEKRVKSRFSQRQLIVKCPVSLEECQKFFENALFHSSDDESFQGITKSFLKDSRFQDALNAQLTLNNSLGRIVRALIMALDSMALFGEASPTTLLDAMESLGGAQSIDNFICQSLRHISVLELCMLASLVRIDHKKKSKGRGATFEEAYAEYETLQFGGSRNWGRTNAEHAIFSKRLALKAWEKLVEIGLLKWVTRGPKEARAVYLRVEEAEIYEALKVHRGIDTTVERWGAAWLE